MSDQNFNLGRHEALITELVNGQREIFKRLGEIEDILAEQRGARKVALWAAGMGGGIVSTIGTLFLKNVFHW